MDNAQDWINQLLSNSFNRPQGSGQIRAWGANPYTDMINNMFSGAYSAPNQAKYMPFWKRQGEKGPGTTDTSYAV